MRTLTFSLATVFVVAAIAICTWALLGAAGVYGSDCRYTEKLGRTC